RPFAKLAKTTEAQSLRKHLIALLSPFLLVNWSFAFPRSRQLPARTCVTAYPPRSRRGVFLLLTLKPGEVRFGVQKFWEIRSTGEGRDNEDTDINNNIGVTAHGVRPDSGAATVAGADERTADDSAGERKEHTSRARAE